MDNLWLGKLENLNDENCKPFIDLLLRVNKYQSRLLPHSFPDFIESKIRYHFRVFRNCFVI